MSWRGSAWPCRGKPRVLPHRCGCKQCNLSCTHKRERLKISFETPSQYGVPLFAGFFHSFFYHTDDMVVSQIEAGAEVILRAYFAEGIFHGYVADLGLAVQALLHGAVQAADFCCGFLR